MKKKKNGASDEWTELTILRMVLLVSMNGQSKRLYAAYDGPQEYCAARRRLSTDDGQKSVEEKTVN